MTGRALTIDPGLLARFREAGAKIEWRAAPGAEAVRKGARARVAHLHDEEARIESWGSSRTGGIATDSGPLGALVLLLEADRRGVPDRLGAWNAGTQPSFPSGALVGTWGGRAPRSDSQPRLADLVELARYALA